MPVQLLFENLKRHGFSSHDFFGKKFNKYKKDTGCAMVNLVISGLLNYDGTVDIIKVHKNMSVTMSEMWIYIYYLFQHNKSKIEVFKRISNTTNNADAVMFVQEVKTKLTTNNTDTQYIITKVINESGLGAGFDLKSEITEDWVIGKVGLAVFINVLLKENNKTIHIPILSQLFDMLEKRVIEKEKNANRMLEGTAEIVSQTIDALSGKVTKQQNDPLKVTVQFTTKVVNSKQSGKKKQVEATKEAS